ncbi:hypothetical protein NPIL_236701, partial [Nephila pilipes]
MVRGSGLSSFFRVQFRIKIRRVSKLKHAKSASSEISSIAV